MADFVCPQLERSIRKMFLPASNYDLLAITAMPIVLVVQLWTLAIFRKNRSRWRAFDVAIVAILVECVVRNLAIGAYLGVQQLDGAHRPPDDVCDVFAWTLHSTHTFHATCLATLAVVGVFAVKLRGRRDDLRHYLTPTHLVYHLFCVTTLCACVGVAAILAAPETYARSAISEAVAPPLACHLLPSVLDVKYAAFIVILHAFLAAVGVVSGCYASAIYWRMRRTQTHAAPSNGGERNFYDTYTLHRGANASYVGFEHAYTSMWRKGDFSQGSTTVSSTNSRRPLDASGASTQPEDGATGLATINPVLLVSYAFYHLPVICLCIFPSWISPWPVSTAILWLGLLQDVLLPISLGIADSRFNQWVSKVYRCNARRHIEGKLPHMGLDGKFRHFSASQPQSLEVSQMHPLRCCQPFSAAPSSDHAAHHKFPITNGSLYTRIDGRVPVIHNYRRQRHDARIDAAPHSAGANLNLHSANLLFTTNASTTTPTATTMTTTMVAPSVVQALNSQPLSSSSTATSSGSHSGLLRPYLRHVSLSQSSLRQMPLGDDVQLAKMHGSKSYDSLRTPPAAYHDEYADYDSSSSSFSITTEANGDFEFFRKDNTCRKQEAARGSSYHVCGNPKRSLEDLQVYMDEDYFSQQSDLRSLSAEHLHDAHAQCTAEASFLDGVRRQPLFFAGSVPDFKKVFISEYL